MAITAKWAKEFKAAHPEINISLASIDRFVMSFGYNKSIRKHMRGLENATPILYSGWKHDMPQSMVEDILDVMIKTTPPMREFVLTPFPSELTYLRNQTKLRINYTKHKREDEKYGYSILGE